LLRFTATLEVFMGSMRSRLRPRSWVGAAAVIALGANSAWAQSPQQAQAQTSADVQQIRQELERLRQEFESVRDSYGSRLSALEARLAALTGAPPQAPPTPPGAPPATPPTAPTPVPPAGPPVEVQVPAGAAGSGGPQGALPVYGGQSALSKIFNPDIAVIGNFLGAAGRNSVDPAPAFELGEAEATFQAVVDPYARADFFFSFTPEGVEVEEGYATFPALPGGLLAKVGRMKEQVGKVNTLHPHSLPWVDEPLVMRNLLGGSDGLADAGISVSRLILNPVLFLEATGEIYQGNSSVFQSHTRGDVSWVGRVRGYRDVTESTNLDIGASIAGGHNDAGPGFTTRVMAIDATFRYRPLRRAIYRRFIGRTELLWSRREQEHGVAAAFGMYASADYQFSRRWFAGARYDWSERAADPSLADKGPSLLLTYWPSEFSQVRGQYRRIRFAEGVTSNEILFQLLFSIGAHGAHIF
jgi:hypothetical protein